MSIRTIARVGEEGSQRAAPSGKQGELRGRRAIYSGLSEIRK